MEAQRLLVLCPADKSNVADFPDHRAVPILQDPFYCVCLYERGAFYKMTYNARKRLSQHSNELMNIKVIKDQEVHTERTLQVPCCNIKTADPGSIV